MLQCVVIIRCYLYTRCTCRYGYNGDGIISCDPINHCLGPDRGGCHEQVKPWPFCVLVHVVSGQFLAKIDLPLFLVG